MKIEIVKIIKTIEIDETKATKEDFNKIIQLAKENNAEIRVVYV